MGSLLPFALSAGAGGLTTLALPPYGYWWLAIFSLALLAHRLAQATQPKALLGHALCFGLGFFGTGISWVFVSIHQFGSASLPVALLLTAVFVLTIAVLFALPFYGLRYCKSSTGRLLLGFPLCWALSEWLRSWVFTGLPWLYLGYGHIDTPLVGWAPIGGVLLISLIAAFTSSVLCNLFYRHVSTRLKGYSGLIVLMLWAPGTWLLSIPWTQPLGAPIGIGIVQPNIPQALKWSPDFKQPTLEILRELSDQLWDQDWVIWPEAAIPDIYSRAKPFIETMDQQARATHTSLITGILYDDQQQQKYLNSLLGLGTAQGVYFKQRLVPFGEYVPLESQLRGLIDFFDLPTSIIAPGPAQQAPIVVGDYAVASSICYEIVYPSLVAELARNTHIILTVSNDAWFGQSIGPLQHFHMARMRAVETGRYVVRGTNNGISAIIAPDGSIKAQSEQFIRTTLSAEAIPMTGSTPYVLWKDALFLLLCTALLCILLYQNRQRIRPPPSMAQP